MLFRTTRLRPKPTKDSHPLKAILHYSWHHSNTGYESITELPVPTAHHTTIIHHTDLCRGFFFPSHMPLHQLGSCISTDFINKLETWTSASVCNKYSFNMYHQVQLVCGAQKAGLLLNHVFSFHHQLGSLTLGCRVSRWTGHFSRMSSPALLHLGGLSSVFSVCGVIGCMFSFQLNWSGNPSALLTESIKAS